MTVQETTLVLLQSLATKVDAIQSSLQPLQAEFYSIKQAAVVVGVSADHIRRAVVGGTLACSNVGTMGRPTYRIARTDLLAWVEKQKAGAIPPARFKVKSIPVSRHHRPGGGHSGGPGS
jgi:excisionase family DNA binding protein